MVIAIGVLLALVCLAVAAIPFLKYRHSRQTVDPLQVISELQAQRQRLYKELLTLEENSKTGAVPEPEFNAVSLTLRRRAAENLWIQRRWEEQIDRPGPGHRAADLSAKTRRFFLAGH